ncbi:MAG: 30S ribosome-binding factor RbfA [Phycisphaerales bacterium]|nr:30S ribosome-binding factor RbfA [Phycisphaerales bacterium]
MSHRRDRLSHVVREVVSDAIANRLSDPRISRFTSVVRVEMSADLRVATIHVSVMGSDTDARTTMRGLESARGLIQSRLARQLDIRHCPSIRFHLDIGIKRAIETYQEIGDLKNDWSESKEAPFDEKADPSGTLDLQEDDTSTRSEVGE